MTTLAFYPITTMSNNNNKGYEYEIVEEAMGRFIEVFATDERGERGEMHLAIYVNEPEGESVEDAVKASKTELYDPTFLEGSGIEGEELARQRAAFEWFVEAYESVQDGKKAT